MIPDSFFQGKRNLTLSIPDDVSSESVNLGTVIADSLQITTDEEECGNNIARNSYSFNVDIAEELTSKSIAEMLGFEKNLQNQVNTERCVIIQYGSTYINRPSNLKYPNKKRARRIWKKWAKRFGIRPADKQIVIPKAKISTTISHDKNEDTVYNTSITAQQ